MPRENHNVTREDIMDMAVYAQQRKELRTRITELKKNRRLHIGPDATAYFENYDTIVHQIHEMLHIEKGGEEQIDDELSAYSTLMPNGSELVATLMFEIDDPKRREKFLAGLGGVEETISIEFMGEKIMAVAETDIDRTTAEGKASSIQFVHFPFNAEQIKKFKQDGAEIIFSIAHEKYSHMAKLPEPVRAAVAGDFA